MAEARDFLAGAIEGFYGQPWSQSERLDLFRRMAGLGLNTYMYAPKDDLKHRAIWRECYSAREAEGLRELVKECGARGIRFVYGLGPGLDISYGSADDLEALKRRFAQLAGWGCSGFALLFDDIPDRMSEADRKRFGSFAAAQAQVANELHRWLGTEAREPRMLFCPTPYCGRMAGGELGGRGYLETLGRELLPEIDVFWTGPEIISDRITVKHLREVRTRLKRKPLIWDNLHANDYDGRRFFCGPYAGRELGIREEVSGLLSNPNCEYPLNYVALRTLGRFAVAEKWDEREEYLKALEEWAPRFETVRGSIGLEEVRSFMDGYYLPFEDGPEATRLLENLRTNPAEARKSIALIKAFCVAAVDLKDRPLFYALSRRVWELREEVDLLERWLDWKASGTRAPFRSDYHLPGTYLGGFVSKLQALLKQKADGTFDSVL